MCYQLFSGKGVDTINWTDNDNAVLVTPCAGDHLEWFVLSKRPAISHVVKETVLERIAALGFNPNAAAFYDYENKVFSHKSHGEVFVGKSHAETFVPAGKVPIALLTPAAASAPAYESNQYKNYESPAAPATAYGPYKPENKEISALAPAYGPYKYENQEKLGSAPAYESYEHENQEYSAPASVYRPYKYENQEKLAPASAYELYKYEIPEKPASAPAYEPYKYENQVSLAPQQPFYFAQPKESKSQEYGYPISVPYSAQSTSNQLMYYQYGK